MESWVSLGGNKGHTNIQSSAEPGSNWGPWGQKTEILPTAPTMPATAANMHLYIIKMFSVGQSGFLQNFRTMWSDNLHLKFNIRYMCTTKTGLIVFYWNSKWKCTCVSLNIPCVAGEVCFVSNSKCGKLSWQTFWQIGMNFLQISFNDQSKQFQASTTIKPVFYVINLYSMW